ncbi:MAG TPA: magnesium transporter [Phycisphaerae bacterium]|nr:magnesium transporter [Phycisphaerae bacterium]
MLGTILQTDIEDLIAERRWDELADAVWALPLADLAEIVIDLPPDDEVIVFRVLSRPIAAEVFAHLPLEHQKELLQSLASEHMLAILEHMSPDDRAHLLHELPAEVTRRLLESLPPRELKATREILGYPPHTAGRYMTPQYVSLRPDMTAAEALEHVRQTGHGKETLNVLYIVDADGKLLEDLRLGALVLADRGTKVSDIEDRPLVSIPATADRDEVVRAFEKYDRFALPVTDAEGHMLGIITMDDVLDVAASKATKDIQRIGGTGALGAPYLHIGFRAIVRKRGGWLSALFLGEMLTATAMGYFQNEIARAVVLAMFVPLIISSGGNSGSQAATLIVRSLALAEVRLRDWWRVFRREVASGVTLGAWLGLIGFLRVTLWQHLHFIDYGPHYLLVAATVWISLIGVVTFGTLAGSMLPFLLRRLGLDPATSSAPFVATLVDVTGLVIYFVVAAVILHGTLL